MLPSAWHGPGHAPRNEPAQCAQGAGDPVLTTVMESITAIPPSLTLHPFAKQLLTPSWASVDGVQLPLKVSRLGEQPTPEPHLPTQTAATLCWLALHGGQTHGPQATEGIHGQ